MLFHDVPRYNLRCRADCCGSPLRFGWDGMGWVGLGWVGLGWVGLGWVGLGWVGLGWVALHSILFGQAGSSLTDKTAESKEIS